MKITARSERHATLSLIVPALLLAACASAGTPRPDPMVPEAAMTAGQHSNHVIVISVDGLRPDAIAEFEAETLLRLMAEGSHTLEAKTIEPSLTLPSHTSMLTGAEPEAHGVRWNDNRVDEHGHVATPTIFARAKDAGFSTAAFFSKSKFEHLAEPGTIDHADVPNGWLSTRLAGGTMDRAETYLENHRPNLLFIHITEPDLAGHAFGWMGSAYGWAVRKADREIAGLLVAADRAFGAGNYTVLITADHGGHGRDHDSADPQDVTIPWIAWGMAVAPGVTLGPGVRTVDTAASALWLLGVNPSGDSAGRVVARAFRAGARRVVVP